MKKETKGASASFLRDSAARSCARAVLKGDKDRADFWAKSYDYWATVEENERSKKFQAMRSRRKVAA